MTYPLTEIENHIIETWRIHNRMTLFVVENIADEALKATLSTRGGRDIARQHFTDDETKRFQAA